MRDAILAGLFLGIIHGMTLPANANSVTPSFTRGTMTSNTDSTTTVTETYNIVEYSTGSSYTMSGTNITWEGTPARGVEYTQVIPGAATQFSETWLGPGVSKETQLTRTTTVTSVTNSVSVFTQ